MPDEMAVLTSRPPPNMAAPTRTSRRVINGELRGCDRSRRWASANRTMWQWQARPPRACASLSLERQRLTRCRSAADFRVELPGGGKIGFAARAIAGQLLGAAAVIERPGVLRIDPDGGIEIRDRALIVALVGISAAAPVIGEREVRIERDGVVEVRDRAIVVALLEIGVGPIVEGRGIAGVELERAREVCDRTVVVPAVRIGAAAVVEGGDEGRIKPQGLAVLPNRAVVP